MSLPLKPIYLLADSRLLFQESGDEPLLLSARALIESRFPKAAYVGASNGDLPEYYSIFEAAMEAAGIEDCRMIGSDPSAEEMLFLEDADLILLAGGDVLRGWKVFERNGLKELILRRYYEGALLIGVSAGAVQLGVLGWPESGLAPDNLTEHFKLVPFIVAAHDEAGEWEELKSAVRLTGGRFRGLGIPKGGGAVYHADHTVEPVRRDLLEFSFEGGEVVASLLQQP
jgi:peptidase E